MRILIFHGYLLGGTGSNVYNARLAEALVGLGHEVHLLAQERHPDGHTFVDATGSWDTGALELVTLHEGRPRCTLYRPAIDGLLPVYVEDRYEGVRARAFWRCSDSELERYLSANIAATSEVSELIRPDIALANHVLMGPVVLARALRGRVPYAVKVHGSALEYTVKRDPERFLPFAQEGLAAANGILVGSSHTAESLWEALGNDWVESQRMRQRTRLGPPGVDVHAFAPRSAQAAADGLRALAGRMEIEAADDPTASSEQDHAFARDAFAASGALRDTAAGEGPLVAYVGKLIVSKGVDLLLAAWPLVLEQVSDARLLIVGFGSLREPLEELQRALADGDLDAAREFALSGRTLEGGLPGRLAMLLSFFESLKGERLRVYLRASVALRSQVRFAGRLDHPELVDLLPACEALVVPSTFPEAFGMVAAEAAACGALPVSAAHSGLAEVSAALARSVPEEAAALLSFDLGDKAVEAIADRLIRWAHFDEGLREKTREGMVQTVRDRWSWEGVAAKVIVAATGASAPLS